MTTAQIVEVTPQAAERLDAILKEQGGEGSMLRVMVMPSPHGGIQYSMGVESEAQADDLVIEAENIRVLIDPESAPLVEGAQIDYVDGLMRSGFTISNPNQPAGGGGCACGGGGGGCGGGGGGGCGGGGGGGCGCGGHKYRFSLNMMDRYIGAYDEHPEWRNASL